MIEDLLKHSTFMSYEALIPFIAPAGYQEYYQESREDGDESPIEWLESYASNVPEEVNEYLAYMAGFYIDHGGIWVDWTRLTLAKSVALLLHYEYETSHHVLWRHFNLCDENYCGGHLRIVLEVLRAAKPE